jgi:uncharacterized protein with von Willebrand factor type A (vWA) domain
MESRIIEFAALLRSNGIPVSVSENIDAVRALELIGIEDPRLFRDALRSTLVKHSPDLPSFERLFDLFFLGLSSWARTSETQWLAETGLSPDEMQKLLDLIGGLLAGKVLETSPLGRALLAGNMGEVERLLYEAARRGGAAEGTERQTVGSVVYSVLAERLGMNGIRSDFESFKSAATLAGMESELLARLSQYADWRLEQLSRLLQEFVSRDSRMRTPGAAPQRQPENLLEKSFVTYTEDDIRGMRRAVTRLAQQFKDLLSLRRKSGSRGKFDIKETLRRNLQYGGVPFQIRWERKRKEKPAIVVLCDISDSVLNASRFMLHFVYSVQDLYHKVRSFVFVSDIGEATRLFEEHDLETAVEKTLKGDIVDVFAHSNFGRAFEIFYQRHLSAITAKTTVIVVGDGRNNYHRPNDWALREIREKAKQLIWLNPENRWTWGYGDSEMPRYIPHCDRVEECRNVRQLYHVMDRISA